MLNSRPMAGWSKGDLPSSQKPSHQFGSWPVPRRHDLSMNAMYDTSQLAPNSTRVKCRFGCRSGTPPPIRSAMIFDGLAAAVLPPPIVRPATMLSVSWPLPMFIAVIMPLTVDPVRDASSLTFTPPVATWMKTGSPFASAQSQTGSYSRDQYGSRGVSRSHNAPRAGFDHPANS